MNIYRGISLLMTGTILVASLSFINKEISQSIRYFSDPLNDDCTEQKIESYDVPLAVYDGDSHLAAVKPMSNTLPNDDDSILSNSDNSVVIDMSSKNSGYIKVKSKDTKRIKVKVINNAKEYTYDLNNKERYETFPLQMGNGEYTVKVMQQVVDNRYIAIFTASFDVKLKSSNAPFLVPSQYVNYTSTSNAVKKAKEICKNKKTDVSKLNAIYDYVIKNIDYDTKKAKTVKQGYIPTVDSTLKTKKGICFDYACLLAAMLRSQNIPTRLVIGTVSPKDLNHAWNEVYIKGKGWVTVKVYFDGNQWKRMDATFGSSSNKDIGSFIGDGDNYTSLRIY